MADVASGDPAPPPEEARRDDAGGTGAQGVAPAFDPAALTRPDPALLTHYLIVSLSGLIFFPFIFLPLYFKYRTLEYAFDDEGVSMSWGVLFRREVYLTYRRLQDIQMTRGVIQRRLGLADLHLHTAFGRAGAEMRIEGVIRPEALRDFLYARMRGAEGEDGSPRGELSTSGDLRTPGHLSTSDDVPTASALPTSDDSSAPGDASAPGAHETGTGGATGGAGSLATTSPANDEALRLLTEIRDELRRMAGGEGPRS